MVPPTPRLDPSSPAWFMHMSAMTLLTRYTTIHGFAALLERVVDRHPVDHERLARYSHELSRQIGDLGRLLEQYLRATQLHAGLVTIERRPVSLDELAEAAHEQYRVMPESTTRHALMIELGEPVTGQWDPHWLLPALSALLSNALKFTPDGGTITVQLERQDDTAVVTVIDPGLGISEDEREIIFLPFVRGSAARPAIPGWGLGLFIAAQAIHAHGGEIGVDSAPGSGTTMTVRLPVRPDPVA